MSSGFQYEDSGEFFRAQMGYWRQVDKSEGFDLEGITVPDGTIGLMPYNCERQDIRYPDPALVQRYARAGLHHYNICHDTNLKFHHLKKFNVTMNCVATYYITLVACNPASSSLVTLQVRVAEGCRGSLNLRSFIARRRPDHGTPPPSQPIQLHDPAEFEGDPKLPSWPSDFSDSQRFHELKESELKDNDWVRLYLELALCSTDRELEESDLSELQIVKVAIETIKGNDEQRQANVYITFKGLAVSPFGELGEHVVRKVIVGCTLNLRTRCMTFAGGYDFCIGEVAEERDISRPSYVSLLRAGKFVPYQGPMIGPPLAGAMGSLAREMGLFPEYRQD